MAKVKPAVNAGLFLYGSAFGQKLALALAVGWAVMPNVFVNVE